MAGIPSGEFKPTSISSIVYGVGSAGRVREKVEELGARRALVVTGASVAIKTDLVERVKKTLGDRYANVFSGVVQHVPRECVLEGVKLAREAGTDLLISLGGSSASDAAKAINLVLTESEHGDDFFVKFDKGEFTLPGSLKATEFKNPKLPFIAIPTTLSGGEFTAGAGITDPGRKHKDVCYSSQVVAKVVILDPEMTLYTGRELWASTALKSMADCFEVVCSPRHQPFVDALALHATQLINRHLRSSIAEPPDLGARAMLQHAAGMSSQGAGAIGAGIVAALRHQIGGIYNVGHGVASTIVFPHGIDFNRPEVDQRLSLLAKALDLPPKDASAAAAMAIERIKELITEVRLPTRLRDVRVPREGLEVIAEACMTDHQIRNNPKPVSKEELIGVLKKAW